MTRDGSDNAPGGDGPANSPEADRYARVKRRAMFASLAVSVAAPVLFIALDGSTGLRDAVDDITGTRGVAILIYAVVAIAGLSLLAVPLDYYSGYTIEHRFGLSRATFPGWVSDRLKSFAIELVLGVAAIELIYGLIALTANFWWLIAATAFIAFFVILARLSPVLIMPIFFKFERLEDAELRSRLLALANRLGTQVQDVFIWKLGEKTRKSNAALMGWGGARRIIVADTMLESNTADEIEAVLAHELGHHVNRDILRLIVVQSAIIVAGFAAVHGVLRALSDSFGFEGMDDVANLPLLLLVAIAGSLLILPLVNAYSRRRERAADLVSLEAMGRPADFIAAMRKLGDRNLAQMRPHPVAEFIFHSHPSLAKRIAFAEEWARRRG